MSRYGAMKNYKLYGVWETDLPELDEKRAEAFYRRHAGAFGMERGGRSYAEELAETVWVSDIRGSLMFGSALCAVAAAIEREVGIALLCEASCVDLEPCIGVLDQRSLSVWASPDWKQLEEKGMSREAVETLLDRYLVELYGVKTWRGHTGELALEI